MRTKWIIFGTLLMSGVFFCQDENTFNFSQEGIASYYHRSLSGNSTANGDRYHPDSLTAAHLYLPFGARVFIENLDNGESIWVRINDRGPYVSNRIIDVSEKVAQILQFKQDGLAQVKISTHLNYQQLAAMNRRMDKVPKKYLKEE